MGNRRHHRRKVVFVRPGERVLIVGVRRHRRRRNREEIV